MFIMDKIGQIVEASCTVSAIGKRRKKQSFNNFKKRFLFYESNYG